MNLSILCLTFGGFILTGGYLFWFLGARTWYYKIKNKGTQYEEIRDFRPAEEILDIYVDEDPSNEWLYAID